LFRDIRASWGVIEEITKKLEFRKESMGGLMGVIINLLERVRKKGSKKIKEENL